MPDFSELNLWTATAVLPYAQILIAIVFGKLILSIADNVVVLVLLKIKGYRQHEQVMVDGRLATITKMGFLSIHLRLENGSDFDEYLAVSNTKIDTYKVHRLVPKLRRVGEK